MQAGHQLKQAPLLMENATEKESDWEEEMCVWQKCRKMITSGKVRIDNSMVVRKITWTHDLV